jgi:hypothetical protein
MMMRTRALLSAAAMAAAVVAVPAGAANASDTIVTFSVTGSALTIAAPTSASLGSGQVGSTVQGQLGAVTVTDGRGVTPSPWTASVSSTSFTTGGGTPDETIPNTDVRYWSGPATATTGSGTFVPGQPTAAEAVVLNTTQTAFSHTGGAGGNSANWNPTLIVQVPAVVVAGGYTGTVTHSVA